MIKSSSCSAKGGSSSCSSKDNQAAQQEDHQAAQREEDHQAAAGVQSSRTIDLFLPRKQFGSWKGLCT